MSEKEKLRWGWRPYGRKRKMPKGQAKAKDAAEREAELKADAATFDAMCAKRPKRPPGRKR